MSSRKPVRMETTRKARKGLILKTVISTTRNAMHKRTMSIDIAFSSLDLEFIGDLDDPYHNFVRIAVFVNKVEANHGIIPFQVCFHLGDLVVLQVFFQLLLKNVE